MSLGRQPNNYLGDFEWHLAVQLEGGTAIDIKSRYRNDVAEIMIEELLKIKAGKMLLHRLSPRRT